MLLNYVKSAHRNVMRNKVQSIIQIFSLALGLTVFILVALFLYDAFTLDRTNPNFSRVYRVEMPGIGWGADDIIPIPLGPEFDARIPEIAHMSRVRYHPQVATAYFPEDAEKALQSELQGILLVDTGFFHIFPQYFLKGDPAIPFDEPYTIILTESTSTRIFGMEDPMGKTIYTWNGVPNRVVGVIRDPVNTHLKFEALTPFSTMYATLRKGGKLTDASRLIFHSYPCYVSLHPGVDIEQTERKMENVWMEVIQRIFNAEDVDRSEVHLRSLAAVHFADIDPSQNYMTHVNRKRLVSFLILGLGILILGVINYINLATARASRRAREVAIRKIVGSTRKSLTYYFLLESVLTTFFAFLIALTLVQLLFTPFNKLLQADIDLYYLKSPWVWLLTLAGILFLGFLSGIYPALKLSREAPLSIFVNAPLSKGSGLLTRRVLMVIQFSSAVVLLIGIFSMQRQIKFMQTMDLGFNKEQVLHLGSGSMSTEHKLELLRRLDRLPEVEAVCLSQPVPGLNTSDDVPVIEDPNSVFYGLAVKVVMADANFFEVYDLNFQQGGEFLDHPSWKNYAADSADWSGQNLYVINETLQRAIGIEDPVGLSVSGAGPRGTIAGVIDDFHFQSLKFAVKPMVIWLRNDGIPWHISMKVRSPDMIEAVKVIKAEIADNANVFQGQRLSGLPPPAIQINFVDETFAKQYEEVERLQTASSYLSIMAVLIACLGLFGLSTFMAQRRIREIGIRKVFGASEEGVFLLLAKDFLTWVSVSVLIGLPLGIVIMQQWQKQFAYRVNFGPGIYLLTILIVFVVSLSTVAWQSVKAARTNPVDSLRTD